MLLIVQRVLDGQQAAPRVAVEDEVAGVQPERPADLLHLIDEAAHLPQRRLVRLVAEARPELVVVVVLDPCRGQIAVARLQVLVGSPPGRRAAAAPAGRGCCRPASPTPGTG